MAATSVNPKAESYREQIRKIIESTEFHGRTRLAEFLVYASEAALQGRTHLDQSEIADRILHRGPNFNPLDDASVRKLATIVRQRLEHYYSGSGIHDPIIVTLPIRSYIVQFREADIVEEKEKFPSEIVTPAKKSNRHLLWLLPVLLLSLGAAAFFVWQHQPAEIENPVWKLATVRGDFMHSDLDLPGSAIRVGTNIADTDDVTVRMQFSPEHAVQQAGLLVFENADRYIKLGRQFLSRPALEFGLETQARYQKPPNTYIYDPDAQNGEPIWLSIRRDHATFKAFTSLDGTEWRNIGNTLVMPDPLPNPRVAIFADHGRTNAPVNNAFFDHLSTGLEFHDFPLGPTDLKQFAGWDLTTNCASGPGTIFRQNGLIVRLSTGTGGCNMEFVTPIPGADWVISTKLDFLPADSELAGLVVQGSKGLFRLIRWDLNGGSLTAEHVGHAQANLRDFEGSPPIILRLDCKNGLLYSSFSRDDAHYTRLSLAVPISALGDHIEYGIQVARSSWFAQRETSEARFLYIRRLVMHLANFQ